MKIRLFLYVCMLTLFVARNTFALETIISPDKKIVVHCNITENQPPYPAGQRFYFRIFYNNRLLIADSHLGIDLQDADPIEREFRIYDDKRITRLDTIRSVFNPENKRIVRYREFSQYLQEKRPPFRTIHITFRVCNDGVAFRYTIPYQMEVTQYAITEEHTVFHLGGDYIVTGGTGDEERSQSGTLNVYKKISEITEQTVLDIPLLISASDNAWMAISESGLADFPGMRLKKTGNNRPVFETVLTSLPDRDFVKAEGKAPVTSNWRVILIEEIPENLAASDLYAVLNEPSPLGRPEWIRPGKCLDPAWSGYRLDGNQIGGMDTETVIGYVDFAASHDFQYVLLNDDWYQTNALRDDISVPVAGLDMERIITRGRENGVGIFLGIGAREALERFETVFPQYQKWGAAGLRIGPVSNRDQRTRTMFRRMIEKAAGHRLMVQLTGEMQSAGYSRTYPHVIFETAIPRNAPDPSNHNQPDPEAQMMMLFSRRFSGRLNVNPGCLAGIMKDGFDPGVLPRLAPGTRCRQLALYVVFDTPVQMVVDSPGRLTGEPSFNFIKEVPTVWDDVKILDGQTGDYIVLARKHGREWYLAGLTDWSSREPSISLSFLDEGDYTAVIYSDKANIHLDPDGLLIREITVTRENSLTIPMGPGSGYVAKLTPVK